MNAWGRPDRNRDAPRSRPRPEPGRPRARPAPPSLIADRSPRKETTDAAPPPDAARSPRTGYTRAHWEAAADALLAAVEPHATDDRALYHFPGSRTSWSGRLSDGLEGYARTLLLAAFRRDESALERYATGLAAGVTGVWPRIEDRSQPLVEAASIALALRLTRPCSGTAWTTASGSAPRTGSATR